MINFVLPSIIVLVLGYQSVKADARNYFMCLKCLLYISRSNRATFLVNAVNVNVIKRVSLFLCVSPVTVSALFPHSPRPDRDISSGSLVYSHLGL